MANQYNDFDDIEDDDNEQQDNGPANLRKALKRAEREKQKMADELAEIRRDLRTRSLKEVLESEGVNPKIAKLMPSEVQTPEEVKAWLADYSDVFGAPKPAATGQEADDVDVASHGRMQQAINTAQSSSKMEDLAALVANAKSRDDLDALTGNLSFNGRR